MTPNEARDEMLAIFKIIWDDQGYTAVYTDVPGSPPSASKPWARPTIKHALGGQASLSSDVGTQIYTQVGTLFIQVFAPLGDGGKKANDLAQLLLVAYSTARGGSVWYRNQRLKNVGSDGAFENVNVLIDFTYDDTR